jgi:enoyl-CoA hydratase/carnithine racemase
VLVEYVCGGSVVIVTLNRPPADNAITTELGPEQRDALAAYLAALRD